MATDSILRPGELKDVLLKEIQAADLAEIDVREVGTALEVKDGIARIYGLTSAMAGEMLEFTASETGEKVAGVALNLEEDNIGAVILGDYLLLREGDEVRRTARVLEVPVGPAMVGRVVDALGRPVDGLGPIQTTKARKVEIVAPGIIKRQPVKEPLQTGIKAIDSMIPIGRGQRELIIGDRGTGKTAIGVDTIINQKGQGVFCFYVAIGQKRSTVAQVVKVLEDTGAMAYTTVVVASAVEEVLAHGAPRERRHPLDRRGLVGRRRDDDRVLHRPHVAEPLNDLRDGRALLPDRDVDADHVSPALVDDRVDGDRGLAGRAVADDQLALAAADRDHRVDCLQARLQRLLHRLSPYHARRLELERPSLGGLDRPEAVERVAQRVDDAAEERVAHGHAHHLTRATDGLAFGDVVPLSEERRADVVLLQVERDADDTVLELEALESDAVLEAVDTGDAVADLEDGSDLGEVGLDVELLDPVLQDRGDLFGA